MLPWSSEEKYVGKAPKRFALLKGPLPTQRSVRRPQIPTNYLVTHGRVLKNIIRCLVAALFPRIVHTGEFITTIMVKVLTIGLLL